MALLSAAGAFEDVDPHGLATGLLHRFFLKRWVFVRDVGRGVVGVGVGVQVGAHRAVGRLCGGTIRRVGVVFIRFVPFVFRGADVCSLLCLCKEINTETLGLCIGLEELALILVSSPPRGELA